MPGSCELARGPARGRPLPRGGDLPDGSALQGLEHWENCSPALMPVLLPTLQASAARGGPLPAVVTCGSDSCRMQATLGESGPAALLSARESRDIAPRLSLLRPATRDTSRARAVGDGEPRACAACSSECALRYVDDEGGRAACLPWPSRPVPQVGAHCHLRRDHGPRSRPPARLHHQRRPIAQLPVFSRSGGPRAAALGLPRGEGS